MIKDLTIILLTEITSRMYSIYLGQCTQLWSSWA